MSRADAALRESVEEHRDTLEALASSGLDLQLVEDIQILLEEVEESEAAK